MRTPPEELLAFAEDPEAFVRLGPDEERVLTDSACVTFSPGVHFWSTTVQRVRFADIGVQAGLAEVRHQLSTRGRSAAAWAIGPSATPDGVVDELLGLGLRSESDEGSAILVLTDRPEVGPSPFDARIVSGFDDHRASIEIGIEAFGFLGADADDERRRAQETFEAERDGGHTLRLLALDGDHPMATGRAWPCDLGIYLGGGATLPAERGRGAMGALIGAAWDEAVRRGTPALVTHGGPLAAPGLERMGFRAIGRVRHLVDRLET